MGPITRGTHRQPQPHCSWTWTNGKVSCRERLSWRGDQGDPQGVSNPERELSAQRDSEDELGASAPYSLPPDEPPFLSPPSGHVLDDNVVSASAGCPACPEGG